MEKIGNKNDEHSFLDHLEILRWHLIRITIGIFVTGAAGKTIRWVAEIETSEINIV